MPGPLSVTENKASSPSPVATTETLPPSGVNFTAFPTRFTRTCTIRSWSHRTETGAPSHFGLELDPLLGREDLEGLDGLGDQHALVARRARDRELSRAQAGDVGQVADQPPHPGRVELDASGSRRDPSSLRGRRAQLGEHLRAQDDSSEQVVEVMADHREEVVPVAEGGIRGGALGQEVAVGAVPRDGKQRGEEAGGVLAFEAQTRVRRGPFVLEDLVGLVALPGHGILAPGRAVLIRLLTCVREHGVRTRAGEVDDAVRIFQSAPFVAKRPRRRVRSAG